MEHHSSNHGSQEEVNAHSITVLLLLRQQDMPQAVVQETKTGGQINYV
jgi:hypothetical protein